MIEWIKHQYLLWRLGPGLRLAAEEAYDRAWSKHGGQLGPELNLIELSNDLSGYRIKLRLRR